MTPAQAFRVVLAVLGISVVISVFIMLGTWIYWECKYGDYIEIDMTEDFDDDETN